MHEDTGTPQRPAPVAHRLAPLFDFSSIAVVGASDSGPGGPRGFRTLQALGFSGPYYPVNNRATTVQGMKAYPNVASLPEVPDMVLVAVPSRFVPDVIDECADVGVKAAVIVSAGFLEEGGDGAELQARITATARSRGPLVVGPNCLGLVSMVYRCAAFDGALPAHTGNVAVISNSGGLMNETMWTGGPRGIGFSHCVSCGNEAGVTAADLIDYFVADPATDVVLAILETVRDPALFSEACTRARAARKPIVVLKMGRSEQGSRSVSTHTGALAGNDAVYAALFRQLGVIQVDDLDELVDMGVLLSSAVPILRNRRLERAGVIEISGGGKELLCDTCAAGGVELPELSQAGATALAAALENRYPATNPLDSGGSWGMPDKDQVYPAALEVFASEPAIDVVVSRYTIPRVGELGRLSNRIEELQAARTAHPDRLFVVLSRTTDQWCPGWGEAVHTHHIPFLQGYGRGPRALGRLAMYSRFVHGPAERTAAQSPQPVLSQPESARPLDEVESKAILAAVGIPVVETRIATTADEAARLASELGYPAVLKVLAPEIVHKSAQGGVRLGLADGAAVRQAFAELEAVAVSAQATFRGVTVQPMAAPGIEIVLGAQRDPQFGPVILCGLGGVLVEALNDVALRVAPISPEDAEAMLHDFRGGRLLAGLDRAALRQAICSLSDLMLAHGDLASVDVNPVYVYPTGVLAVDARVQRGAQSA
ncbi:MAG: hypothetical protein QOF51_1270 [Chloroflexota bacterium]|nr:hypothetical protein [Chloroflexota bacterium]